MMPMIEAKREAAKDRKRFYDSSPERAAARKKAWADRSPEQKKKQSEYNTRWRNTPEFKSKKNADERARYARRIRADRATWPVAAVNAARSRAKTSGLPFDILPQDIVVPTHCPIRGVELIFGGGRNNPDNPSLDRIIPELGYVRGNVRVISYWANRLKCDCSDAAVFRRLADYVEARH